MASLDEALAKLKHGRFREGQRILERLRQGDPHNPIILYNLGMAYSEQGMFDQSIEALEECIALDPGYSYAYTALGFSYSRKGQYREAIQKFRQALEINPDDFYALKNLGSVYGKLREHEQAIETFERANALAPDSPEVLYGLALVYEETGRLDKAEPLYRKIIRQNKSAQITTLAERAMTQIAQETLKAHGPRFDAVMYMVDALQKFSALPPSEIRQIALEIALLGRSGLAINNPEQQYTLRTLPGTFSGLQLLAYMHVAFKLIDPHIDAGSNLDEEYEAARALFEKGS